MTVITVVAKDGIEMDYSNPNTSLVDAIADAPCLTAQDVGSCAGRAKHPICAAMAAREWFGRLLKDQSKSISRNDEFGKGMAWVLNNLGEFHTNLAEYEMAKFYPMLKSE